MALNDQRIDSRLTADQLARRIAEIEADGNVALFFIVPVEYRHFTQSKKTPVEVKAIVEQVMVAKLREIFHV